MMQDVGDYPRNIFSDPKVLLYAKGLKKYYPVRSGPLLRRHKLLKALDGVDMTIYRGETLGLVGESGCGKSTLGRLLLRLEEPDAGSIDFEGRPIHNLDQARMRSVRKEMQAIFQDPYSSLNPKKTVEFIIGEPLIVYGLGDRNERRKKILKLMEAVGLRPEHLDRYPNEFSGGQRQRICIARALALNPKMIVCDEPTSSLDVSIQAQVLNVLKALQAQFHLTYLFISHNLAVLRYISDRIAVMYLGKVIEMAERENLYRNAKHPYTQALLSASPIPNPVLRREKILLKGDVPSPMDPPSGCHFHTRCPSGLGRCQREEPTFREVGPNHFVSCFLYN
jgi:oligopeptide/dipeptide ABC transporter ATP-binding protein